MAEPNSDIVAALVQLLNSIRDLVLLIIGGLFGFLSSWIASGRERKLARADERRERIYGPLLDELANIVALLPRNDSTMQQWSDYPRIKSAHIRYMIPRTLRTAIVEIYEELLPKYEEQKAILAQKYNGKMREEITRELIPDFGGPSTVVTSTSSPFVTTLANLSYYLVEGRIPPSMEKEVETALFAVREDSRNFPQATWQDFFAEWSKRLQADGQFKKFTETRDKAVRAIQKVMDEINEDLESEN
jgi:hypothetical protein